MRRSATWSSAFEAKWRTCMTISPELAGGLDRGQCVGACAGRKLLVIKPSGVRYDDLSPANMVVTDLEAHLVEGDHAPSSDTAAHAYVYQHMPEVGGVVHTHSTYATAWAARGEPIPCVLTIGATAMAAVKAAVMCEDVARTVHVARQIGQPLPIARSDVDSLFDRYQ